MNCCLESHEFKSFTQNLADKGEKIGAENGTW